MVWSSTSERNNNLNYTYKYNMSSVDPSKFKKLSDIDHVLKRPGMYLGSLKPHTSLKWISSEGRMIQKEITYNPGFLKIFDEIITNSVDESKRKGSKLNTIKITISKGTISIWDNGGIPVLKNDEHNEWIPEMIFSNMKAGSNFDDSEDRSWAGTNGVGSTITNIYSKEFSISTCDGKNIFSQIFSDNMRKRTKPKIKASTRSHTEISYTPDLDKFGLSEIDESHMLLLEKRVLDIAACNPKLKISFNNKPVVIKSFEEYIKLYIQDCFYETKKDGSWSVGIGLSQNGFQQVSFVNSTETYDAGTHVDYILSQIIVSLREFFQKKYKVDIKPSELKNHIFLFVNSTVINPSFSSQTKEKLITEIKDFGYTFEVTQKFIQLILKSEIVASILDWIDQKKLAEENKLQRDLNKNLGKIKIEKLIDAKHKDRWKCSIGIFEGESAISAFRDHRNVDLQGAFALKGKFVNVSEIQTSKLLSKKASGDYNYEELVSIMGAIGLKLGQEVNLKDLRYGRILFYCDADVDGNSIVGLLVNFFYKYWPELFDRKMIYKVETPIVVAIPKTKNKNKIFFYSQSEYQSWVVKNDLKGFDIKYKKGLGALLHDEYKDIIENPKLTQITRDDVSKRSLEIWFGGDSELRKNEMLEVNI
jgi:DNA topoisomerase-2